MTLLTTLLTIYLLLGGLLRLGRHTLVFFPSRELWPTPQALGIPYEDVSIRASDGVQLHAWLLKAENPRATVLFLHGNAGNISGRLENGIRLTELGLDVLLLDYRGYGKSEGSPTEEGTYLDAKAAWDFLENRGGPIVLFGRSLGAAVAVELATRVPCRALIMESAFTSVKDLAKGMVPYSFFLPMIPAMYESRTRIRQVNVPTMIVHGTNDEIIPYAHGQALFAAAPGPKTFYTLEGAFHNDWYQRDPAGYFNTWRKFLQDHGLQWDAR